MRHVDVTVWLAQKVICGIDGPGPPAAEAEEIAASFDALAEECRKTAEHGPSERPNGNDLEADAFEALARLYRHPETHRRF